MDYIRRFAWVTVFGCLICFSASPTRGDDKDLIGAKLEKAKQAYDVEVGEVHKSIVDGLDKLEAQARDRGDKKVVDQVKADRDLFEKGRTMPKSIPLRDQQRQLAGCEGPAGVGL